MLRVLEKSYGLSPGVVFSQPLALDPRMFVGIPA